MQGGYLPAGEGDDAAKITDFCMDDYMRKIPADATDAEREAIVQENQVIRAALEEVKNGTQAVENDIEIVSGMKVIYDEKGELLNIYYVDDFCPEGYTIHGNEGHLS